MNTKLDYMVMVVLKKETHNETNKDEWNKQRGNKQEPNKPNLNKGELKVMVSFGGDSTDVNNQICINFKLFISKKY